MSKRQDEIWAAIRSEAQHDAEDEPLLASFLHATILNHKSLENALSFHLANKLASPTMQAILLMELIADAMDADPAIGEAIRRDVQAVKERDPACKGFSIPLLYFKGFHALQAYRVAHHLWQEGREVLALAMQSRISEVFSVDIHPAAQMGKGILMDHATGIVIGETAVVEDDVSILHHVTLGGTGKACGDRHPKIGAGVLIGAAATILGNIRVGEGAKVGSGSVVLSDVRPHSTVVGVPAREVGVPRCPNPAMEMDHRLHIAADAFSDAGSNI